jgi:chromosome partitioning protein
MPRWILFTSQKGGVGKSTLARSAAVSLAYLGRKVLLADFDVEQRTCMRWHAQRQARALKPAIDVAAFSKKKKLARAELDYDDVIIDTRGQSAKLSRDLAVSSDVVFLPSSFSLDDVLPTLGVVESLRNAGVLSSRIAVAFCRTGCSRKQEQQARSILETNRVATLDIVLPQKDGFIPLYATGRTGRETAQSNLRSVAMAMDQALLHFIDAAGRGTGRRASHLLTQLVDEGVRNAADGS